MHSGNQINSTRYSPPQRPLSVTRHHPPCHYVPLPPTVEGHVDLNPLLRASYGELIKYSLKMPPTAASTVGNNIHWLLEPATIPKLTSMTITASDLVPWPIIVHASNANPSVVTVGDVLAAVHAALRTFVNEYEYRQVLLPDMVARGVGNRYWSRMRRLNLLNGRHWWAGLSESLEGPEMWDLHLRR